MSGQQFPIKIGNYEWAKEDEAHIVFYVHYLYWALVCSVYIICDPIIGILTYSFGQLVMLVVLAFVRLDDTIDLFGGKFYKINCIIQVLAWISQFIGHGIFEKRAPALTTNALFLFIAPFFEMFEVVNSCTGYR